MDSQKKQKIAKHGRHENKSKAKQGVGRWSMPRPTLDAPDGASNTLNFTSVKRGRQID